MEFIAGIICEYKHGVIMYPCLHGRAPRYLADHLIPASDAAPRRRHLLSVNRNCLTDASLSTQHVRLYDLFWSTPVQCGIQA